MSNMRAFSSVITGVLVLVLVVKAQDIGGTPDVDYPNYDTIPKTSFSCSEQKYIPGLYADMETGCQVFHFCEENMQESFLCPPERAFNQASLTCDSWDNFNCSLTPQFCSVNTGPEMDNARRNILMVLQLKNRSRSKLFNRPSDVYEKITPLYDGTVEEHSESPYVPVGLNAESNDGVSHAVSSEEMPEEARERSEENEHGFSQDLSRVDESTLNDEFAYVSEESEDSGPDVFYDPVTEKYFIDYDPLQTVHEVSKEEFDKVGSLSYDGFSKRFGLSYNENVDEMQSDSENEYSQENELKELSEMLATEASKELLETMWDTEPRSLKRVRRRPLYRVVKEDNAAGISGFARNLGYPIDSTDTEVNVEFPPNTSEGNEKPEKAASDVSYEVPEFQYSNIASPGNPEVPQTLEFDQAVLSELSFPEVNEHGLRTYLPSDEEQDESMQSDSQTYQTADEYSYIENSSPVDYESYFTDYTQVDTESAGEPEFAPGDLGEEENSNWYQDESLGSEDSDESQDTYMVIPDEYDNAFDHSSETNEQPETYNSQSDATGSFGASRDLSQSYISPAIYAPVAPYWFPPPYYYPDEYGSREVFNSEHFFNRDSLQSPEYAGRPLNDQDYQYYPVANSGPYAYGSPANFPGHVYDYGAGYVYPYANAYGSPYAENFGYDTSEVKVVTESSILNENSEAAIAGNSDYSEPEMQYWAERFSTESPEIEEEVTESVFPTEESLDNVYMTSDGELDEMPSVTSDAPFDENMKEETFYLFDFDENSDEELIPEATDEVLDNIQFGSSELFQAEEPSRRNESSGDFEGVNVGSESDSTRAQAESHLEFDRQNSKRLSRSETAENEKSIDSTFQTEGTSSDENPVPQTQRPRQPRSYGSNIDLSRDSKFLMDNVYSESNFRLQDAVLAQSYGTEDASLHSNMEDGFFPRTGDARPSRASTLSELQKRILSLKQGKLGTFKKYMNPGGKN